MDLTTRYMGLQLRNPVIASASPLNSELGTLRALEDYGAGAVVLPSIFEEQVLAERRRLEQLASPAASGFAEAQTYFPAYAGCGFGAERYLDIIRRAKAALQIPVIASLSCVTAEGWAGYARELESAGADALELNIHFISADLSLTAPEVEQHHLHAVRSAKAAVDIPVAVKIGPYFSALGSMAQALGGAGADGLVLFNRFYQPDIDVVTLRHSLGVELSTPAEMRLPLLWISILRGRTPISLAASTGVDSAEDVFKYLLAGADAVMTTSALLRHGVRHMGVLVNGLGALLAARGVDRVDEVRGRMSQQSLGVAAPHPREYYIRMLQSYRVAQAS
ncbi:dihydroorotate dehydrogenase (plasmid) [Phenylobacterium zucineum HLK1]|uniref:Dihydroorotate dehydrogenase n=1 Tax=Phenylobacterium zucineum (strain HLK1) TaxID=450851 RepID=B4RIA1_PHEZH|nr:dihydroorotate dehydrogenase-like protein [Phenylobacterium zucineum]ACG80076.1 dihydroorotate dehydrogenase [Phenylobacterium zucineum HLK1]